MLINLRDLRVRYFTALPDYSHYMNVRSPLMNMIREHRDTNGCEDCARFVSYFEDMRYRSLPKVPSCQMGISIVKHYFQVLNKNGWPQAAKHAEGLHRPPINGRHG